MQYLGELGERIEVRRNDEVTVEQIEAMKPDRVLISPGPGTPTGAGIALNVIEKFAGKLPILGVCLGHQAIGQVFGGRVVRASRLFMENPHRCSTRQNVLRGLDNPPGGRYHS